ncbi:MAG: adenylate/guanylate cyclase domain-containing protein [Treponema sp.]|jgi:two-component system sensor histidine kinase ChiS|nr:adenylate/guanylate cyclase domain-containing protein [Treponema sp.]
MDNYRYLLTWIIRLNTLTNEDFRAVNLFILGFICSPLLFFSIQPLREFFILNKGKNYTLHEKSRIGTSFAVLFLVCGLGLNLLPLGAVWPVIGAYVIQTLGLMVFEIFLFFTLYLVNNEDKINPGLFVLIPAAGLLITLFPVAANVPSVWFLGGFSFFLTALILFFAIKEARQKGNYRACLIAGGEVFLIGLSFFMPATGPQILLWALPVLFFQFRGERLFFYPVFFPEAKAEEEVEICEPAIGDKTQPSGDPAGEDAVPEEIGSVTRKMNSFVPKEFLTILNKESVMDLKLGDHVMQEMTIFFSDIRKFTELFEGLSPEDSFKFINSYLTRIVPVIEEYGGFVDKYIGDAILALYPQENGADMAVQAAIEIQRRILEYNTHRAKCGYRPLEIGIGLHTGSLMLGVVGVHNRMQNTAISDSVNLASRVEGLTKAFNVSMTISGQTFQKLEHPESYMFRYLGNVKVKGKGEPTRVYEILDGIDPEITERKMKANRYFEEGMFSYSKKSYIEALSNFNRVLEILPDDGASIAYMQNCMLKLKATT